MHAKQRHCLSQANHAHFGSIIIHTGVTPDHGLNFHKEASPTPLLMAMLLEHYTTSLNLLRAGSPGGGAEFIVVHRKHGCLKSSPATKTR